MITVADAVSAMARFPVMPLDTLLDGGPPLVLAPHPDDESLGCGGLIAACAAAGAPPFVLVLTDGTGSHPNSRAYPAPRLRRLREGEARAAAAELGLPADRIGFLALRDTESPVSGPAFESAVSAVAALAIRMGAGSVLAPWEHDPHGDHESAHLIGAAAARQAGLPHRSYPVWGLTLPAHTPLPSLPSGWRVDVLAQLPAKRRAIAAHRSQYSGLIVDDPQGFQMTPEFMALFDGPFEIVLAAS